MPLVKGFSRDAISKNIDELTHHGSRPRSHDQIVAIAMSEADKAKRQHAAFGGGMGMGESMGFNPMSYEMRSAIRGEEQSYNPSGLIASATAGRTDRIPMSVAANSYIIPADVVSGIGQSNTLNGAKMLDAIIKGGIGPYGVSNPHGSRGSGPPKPPSPPRISGKLADGGVKEDEKEGVSHILAAGGEYTVARDDVERIGARQRKAGLSRARTDLRAGHQALDELVRRVRKHTLEFLKHAPSPKR
jgi:hypothetical protein